MLTIGEFSRVTGLTVKTLRFYHEQGLLAPTHVDEQTGYRYYAETKIETARVIAQLRALQFSVAEIAAMLQQCGDDADVLEFLERHKRSIAEQVRRFRDIDRSLDHIISQLREVRRAMNEATFQIEEKTLGNLLIAGVRMRGKYRDCGQGFSQIGRNFGRHICGSPLMLIYDSEYKEDDADFEVCMPVRKGTSRGDISVRELPGGCCVSLIHQGPYEDLGRSYARILEYIHQQGYQVQIPSREVYLKGPGMIFKGNPKKYLTEIQFLVKS